MSLGGFTSSSVWSVYILMPLANYGNYNLLETLMETLMKKPTIHKGRRKYKDSTWRSNDEQYLSVESTRTQLEDPMTKT